MFNTNSPIVNNMMISGNGGIYPNQGYIPPNPIGNIAPIGNMGYNNTMNTMGGYYSNVYNNYYNPYLAAQQQQLAEAQMKEQQRVQSDMMKRISKSVNSALNNEISDWDSHLKQYDPVELQQQDPEEAITYRLMNVHFNGGYGDPMTARYIQASNMMYEQTRQCLPNDMSMYDFNRVSSDLYLECLKDRQKQSQRDMSKLYDSNQYNQLINMHSSNSNYFNSVFGGSGNNTDVNVNDMEVKLPTHLANEYAQRKKAFLDSIMGGK